MAGVDSRDGLTKEQVVFGCVLESFEFAFRAGNDKSNVDTSCQLGTGRLAEHGNESDRLAAAVVDSLLSLAESAKFLNLVGCCAGAVDDAIDDRVDGRNRARGQLAATANLH